MLYVHISRTPGRSLTDFRAIRDEVALEHVPGHIAQVAGEADGELHIVDVWESKVDADRFAAERLFPAFQRLGHRPGEAGTYVAFETDDVALNGRAR